jgi:hypothetical protein
MYHVLVLTVGVIRKCPICCKKETIRMAQCQIVLTRKDRLYKRFVYHNEAKYETSYVNMSTDPTRVVAVRAVLDRAGRATPHQIE